MKKLALFISFILLLASCASGRYISLSDPQAQFDAGEILCTQHPELSQYYDEGVLKVTSLREVKLPEGGYDYKVDYKFVKYYYRDYAEMIECLKTRFPDVYELYKNGIIEVHSLYKYVDANTMEIRHHISYRRVYGGYYDSYYYYSPVYPYSWYRYRYRPVPVHPRYTPRPPAPSPRGHGMAPNHPRPQGHGGQPPQARPQGNSGQSHQPSHTPQGGGRRR